MRIAVTYENGQVYQHFGHTEQFKLYDIENQQIAKEEIVDTNGNGHGALAGFLANLKADALICGGIGFGAKAALEQIGIKLYAGVSGSADSAVQALLTDSLQYSSDANCDHHNHEHHEGHGQCGENKHGCAGSCH